MNNPEPIALCENKASPVTLKQTRSKADTICHTNKSVSHDFKRYFGRKTCFMRDFPGDPLVKDPPAIAEDKWVQSLVLEDPTCYGATKPGHLEPVLYNKKSHSNEKLVYLNEE